MEGARSRLIDSHPFSAMPSSSDFARRHLGTVGSDRDQMLQLTGFATLDELAAAAVPRSIRMDRPLNLPPALPEHEALAELKTIMGKNRLLKSFIGQGYYGTHTPGVIQRNILENPGWYTAYTPYLTLEFSSVTL